MSANPWEWPLQPAPRSMWIDGRPGLVFSRFGWSMPDSGVELIRTTAGTHVQQRRIIGTTAPACIRPWEKTLELVPADEETYQSMEATGVRGGTVLFFAGWTHTDIWDAVADQEEFSLSRYLPYESDVTLVGEGEVTPSTHRIRAFLNGVEVAEEDILYDADPSPAAGQVGVVLGELAQHRAIRTAPLDAADVLRVIYYPLHAVIVDATHGTGEPGELASSYKLTEAIPGEFD